MKKIVFLSVITISINLMGYSQVDSTEAAYNRLIFGDIFDNHCETDFLLDLSYRNINLKNHNGTDSSESLNYEDWLVIYNDLKTSKFKGDSMPPLGELYMDANSERLTKINGELTVPVGIIYEEYEELNPHALDSGYVYIDERNDLTIKHNEGEPSPIFMSHVFAVCPMIDTTFYEEKMYLDFDSKFIFSGKNIENIDIYHNGVYHSNATIDGTPIEISLYSGINELTFIYADSSDTLISKSTFFNYFVTDNSRNHSSSPFAAGNVIGTPEVAFNTGGIKASIKVFPGCNNPGGIRKPAFFVSGFNPASYEQFFMLINKFNSNGLLDEMHHKDRDVVVVRFNNGTDRVENCATVLKSIIKFINSQKDANGSYVENIGIGYSSGALALRVALKMMEVEYQQNPQPINLHHFNLYTSYDGEHQGANIPLATQQSVHSFSNNTSGLIIGSGFGSLIDLLNNFALINSEAAKDFLKYHHSQTGNFNNPGQGGHPNHDDLFDKFGNTFYYQPAPYDKPGDYPLIRNIAIAQGSANADIHPLGSPSINTLLEYDYEQGDPNNWIAWHRKNYLLWQNVDGDSKIIFRRLFDKKPAFSNNYQQIINEGKFVTNSSLDIDGAPGSTAGFYNAIRGITKAFYILNPGLNVDVQSTDCFVPTVSALDIKSFGNLEYNLRDNDLLWEDPNPQQGFEQNNEIGYPSIIHGSNQYTKTPFDAIFCMDDNTNHGANSETNEITDFIMSEVQYDHIWLQFLRVGKWANAQYNYYPVKYEAVNTIECGEEVTFKTQNKPVIFQPESDVELKAGESIHFKPGTHIRAGANVHAYIAPYSQCPGTSNMPPYTPPQENQQRYDDMVNNTSSFLQAEDLSDENTLKFSVYPNPNGGTFTITNPYEVNLRLSMINSEGKEVHTEMIGTKQQEIFADVPKGLYLIRIEKPEGGYFTQKIIVQ